jgi:hypothetical protein
MPCTSKQCASAVEAAARRLRATRRGHVEEAIEIDPQRSVHRAARRSIEAGVAALGEVRSQQ